MSLNSATKVSVLLNAVLHKCRQLQNHELSAAEIDVLADQILALTKINYDDVSRAFAQHDALEAELLIHRIIRTLGKCIDAVYRVPEKYWYYPKVHDAFTTIDKMGICLKHSWDQYLKQ
jgi:hypothetical protein